MKEFYYIVVTVSGHNCFINRDMDYSDDFETVLKFDSKELAADFITDHKLVDKHPEVRYLKA